MPTWAGPNDCHRVRQPNFLSYPYSYRFYREMSIVSFFLIPLLRPFIRFLIARPWANGASYIGGTGRRGVSFARKLCVIIQRQSTGVQT